MNKLTTTRNIILYLIASLLIVTICIIDSNTSLVAARPLQREPSQIADDYRYSEYSYSPLTYEKFTNIYTNVDELSRLSITYASNRNFDSYGVALDRDKLKIQCRKKIYRSTLMV